MKIQKLEIHNIASIEDATIDFDAPPLSGSDVFLISGDTGSGKTTILDAICLALYNNTPRMNNSEMDGKAEDVDQEISINDVRQMMRRNTVEAFARLTFTGKNAKHYEATWKVNRAHDNITGKLQSVKWILKDLDVDKEYVKVGEINQSISEAVGLKFDQFCRTTMLAQGAFAQFLNSKDNEKAAILEKLTGVDDYTKIGKKIFGVTSDKKRESLEAQKAAENIITLNDDQISEKRNEIGELEIQIKAIQKSVEADREKLTWLSNEKNLAKAKETAINNHSEAQKALQDDDFKRKDSLVKQWNATIEARRCLADKNKAEEERKKQNNKLEQLATEYETVTVGYVFAKEEKKKVEDEIEEIDNYLANEEGRRAAYENAQTIITNLKTIATGREDIARQNAAITRCNAVLEENKPLVEKAEMKMKTCQELFEKQKDTIDKFAKAMRLKLQEGDICPVCRQRIASHLPHDEDLEALVNGLQSEYNKAKEVYDEIKGKITKAENDKGIAEGIINTRADDVKKAEQAVAAHIAGEWEIDWRENPKQFAMRLAERTKEYSAKAERRRLLGNRHSTLASNCANVRSVIIKIRELMPAWVNMLPNGPIEVPNLQEKANNLFSNTSTALQLMQAADDAIVVNGNKLDEFLSEHTEISIERLSELNSSSAQDIHSIFTKLEEKKNKVVSTQSLMDETIRKHKEHQNNRPQLTEEDTEEELAVRIEKGESQVKALSEMIGSINTELKKAQEDKEKRERLEHEAKQKKTEFEKWERLNTMLGDAEGKTFRKIAQSYILGSLIHSANQYMLMLTDRYTLKVKPGSFVIMIEDAYQGYASRVVSTVSGGEGFLVSLALALALSDIGQNLAVDTLFIDEGFGSLSGEPLKRAIDMLRSLHKKSGRQVGVISHIKDVRESIPVQIQVEREGVSSSSKIRIVSN